MDRIVAYVDFLDGARRPVYERPNGKQYVIDDDGELVYGVWYWEPEADEPHVVES